MYHGDGDFEDNYLPEDDPMPGGDSDGLYDDVMDDGILESLIIIGLAAALVFLIYYRQQHQLAHRRNQDNAAAQEGDQAVVAEGLPPQQGDRGLFPEPGDPEFDNWLVGGVGH